MTEYEKLLRELSCGNFERVFSLVVAETAGGRPVYAQRRRQEDGSFKWVVTEGDRTALSRSALEMYLECGDDRYKEKHMKDTRFDTLEEAMNLAQKWEAKWKKRRVAAIVKHVRKVYPKATGKLAEYDPKDFRNPFSDYFGKDCIVVCVPKDADLDKINGCNGWGLPVRFVKTDSPKAL